MELQVGMKNTAVTNLQKDLIQMGITALVPDGDFGPKTMLAVKSVQLANNLPATGIADEATLKLITDTLVGQLAKPSSIFERAVHYVLANEGGYVNDPADAGGATNFGITQHTLQHYVGRPVTELEVKEMPLSTAKEIYRKNYWIPVSCDKITQVGIATCIFDTGVLYGPVVAMKFAQQAANAQGMNLLEDGALGPVSVAALNQCSQSKFIDSFHGLVIARIKAIVAAHPTNAKFKAGWEHRADRLLTLA